MISAARLGPFDPALVFSHVSTQTHLFASLKLSWTPSSVRNLVQMQCPSWMARRKLLFGDPTWYFLARFCLYPRLLIQLVRRSGKPILCSSPAPCATWAIRFGQTVLHLRLLIQLVRRVQRDLTCIPNLVRFLAVQICTPHNLRANRQQGV